MLLSSFEHDYHVTVLPRARGDSASVYLISLTGTELCLIRHVYLLPFLTLVVCVCFHPTHYDTVLSNVDIGTNLCCVDHTVLLDEDMVSDVQREERHSGKRGGEKRKEEEKERKRK